MIHAAGNLCDVRVGSKIVSLNVSGSESSDDVTTVNAITEDGTTIAAKNTVLAAGPWTNEVLELAGLPKLPLEIWMVQWAHYEVDDPKVASMIPQAFHFKEESGIDGGLYYVFPASATQSVVGSGDENKKAYVKVGVDFPTFEPLQSMDSFNLDGSEEVLSLMVRSKTLVVKNEFQGFVLSGNKFVLESIPYHLLRDFLPCFLSFPFLSFPFFCFVSLR